MLSRIERARHDSPLSAARLFFLLADGRRHEEFSPGGDRLRPAPPREGDLPDDFRFLAPFCGKLRVLDDAIAMRPSKLCPVPGQCRCWETDKCKQDAEPATRMHETPFERGTRRIRERSR